jgi:hypothetical protein
MTELLDRLWAAWNAFQSAQGWYVVLDVQPIGWMVTHEAATYDEAATWKRVGRRSGERLLIMRRADWERRSLRLLRSEGPWRDLARLSRRLHQQDVDAAVGRMAERALAAGRNPMAGALDSKTVGGSGETGAHDND